MGYVLLGDIGSGSAVVELTLAELGIPAGIHDVPLDDDAQRHDDYAAVNPQRKLPTLITPDGETLTESAAILLTLAECYPDAGLLPPTGTTERAQAIRWLLFVATELYPLIEIIDYPERFQPEEGETAEDRREEVREHVRKIWKRRWALVEDEIRGEPWFLDGGFSLLDLYIAVVSRWAQLDEWREDALSCVETIAAAVSVRPRCVEVWQRHFG